MFNFDADEELGKYIEMLSKRLDDAECYGRLRDLDEPAQPGFYAATMDYFATGEGRTHAVTMGYAPSRREFVRRVCGKWSGYFALGAEFYPVNTLPPDTDATWMFLLGQPARVYLRQCLANGRAPMLDSSSHMHYNYS